MGGTFYLHYRYEKEVVNQYLLYSDDTYEWTNSNFKRTEYGINPKIGIMWAPADKFSLGVTISRVFILKSNDSRQEVNLTDSSHSLVTSNVEPSIISSDE